MKRLMIGAVAAGVGMIGMTAFGQTMIDVGNPVSGSGYEVSNGVITINTSGEYVLTGETTSNCVVVASGVVATVTLQDVSITSATSSPFEVSGGGDAGSGGDSGDGGDGDDGGGSGDGGDGGGSGAGASVRVRLVGENALISDVLDNGSDPFCPGLRVEDNGSVTIDGSGSLTVQGGMGAAGIGAGDHGINTARPMPGMIIINGGIINVTGGDQGAGIGSGEHGNSGAGIIINGGVVTAIAGNGAAAIGGGLNASGGNITITGGVVLAISPHQGAAIGSGEGGTWQPSAGNIRITGGSVFAWCRDIDFYGKGAGIGGGDNGGPDGSISIEGGNIVAYTIGLGGYFEGAFGVHTSTTVSGGAIITDSINATNFGEASVITGAGLNEAFITTMFANAIKGAGDTVVVEIPGENTYIHDTIRDTVRVGGDETITVVEHDTVRIEIPGPPRYDTVRLVLRDTFVVSRTVRDTLVRISEVRDTTVREILVVIDSETNGEYEVKEDPAFLIVAAPAYGEGMYWFHGLTFGWEFAVYDRDGRLLYRGSANPIPFSGSGTFIVKQGGRYYRFEG